MKINSDKVSEKYRKYIPSIKVNGELLYLIWGTDLTNTDLDYFLLNSRDKVICFRDIQRLKKFIMSSDNVFIDDMNLRKWISLYKSDQPYVIYDIDMITTLILENKSSVLKYSKKRQKDIFSLIVFISDYIYQTNNVKLKRLYNNKHQNYFIYLVGSNFVNIDLSNELSNLGEKFDSNQFKLDVLYMIDFFIKNVDIVE